MQNSKKRKIVFIIIMTVYLILSICNITFASDNFNFTQFDSNNNSDVDSVTKNFMGTGIGVIRVVATGISIVMLSYIGIKYMTAAPSEKADFKKSATIFVVGAILVFAAGNILDILVSFAENNL